MTHGPNTSHVTHNVPHTRFVLVILVLMLGGFFIIKLITRAPFNLWCFDPRSSNLKNLTSHSLSFVLCTIVYEVSEFLVPSGEMHVPAGH